VNLLLCVEDEVLGTEHDAVVLGLDCGKWSWGWVIGAAGGVLVLVRVCVGEGQEFLLF